MIEACAARAPIGTGLIQAPEEVQRRLLAPAKHYFVAVLRQGLGTRQANECVFEALPLIGSDRTTDPALHDSPYS